MTGVKHSNIPVIVPDTKFSDEWTVPSSKFVCSQFAHNHNISTAEYVTNIRNESPGIPYDRQ
jgi:hypothetical protein